MEKVAHVCAWWTLAAGLVIVFVRYLRFNHRWFLFSGAALLQAALHGLLGISYLLAGTVSLGLAILAIALLNFIGVVAG